MFAGLSAVRSGQRSETEVVIHRDRRMVRELHILVDMFRSRQRGGGGCRQVVVDCAKNLR